MLRHVLFLLFLCGLESCRGSGSSDAQEQTIESKDVYQNGIKKNEVGANGLEPNWENVLRNFRNPVLEYLLHSNNPDRTSGPSRKATVREIRHTQTLLIPNSLRSPLPALFFSQLPQFESIKKPAEGSSTSHNSSSDSFWNYLKNNTQSNDKTYESVVTSPVLHLNKDSDDTKEETTVQTYPAVAVVINTFSKDGSLKKSLTHFQPDFHSLRPHPNDRGATFPSQGSRASKVDNVSRNVVVNFAKDGEGGIPGKGSPQGVPWPFAGYFPIVINDPFLTVYNAFATSMYNAVSSMVEYGPEADLCLKDHSQDQGSVKVKPTTPRATEMRETDIFDEVTMRSEVIGRLNRRPLVGERKRRDATSIFVKSREGGTVGITLQEPPDVTSNGQICGLAGGRGDGFLNDDPYAPGSGQAFGNFGNRNISEGSDLILRKGGVAIAGPGGVATAYTGGTAIVGPYGTVYKSPEGTAILGPFSKVINITDDTSFEEILKMHKQMLSQNQSPAVENPAQGRVEFKNFRNFFSHKTDLPIRFELKPQGRSFIQTPPKEARLKEEGILKALQEIRDTEFRRIVEDTPYEQREAKANETTLVFRPKSKAEAGRNGVALSAPTSHAILFPGQKASIYFEPESVASAGPSGFAHAYSDLFVTFVRNDTTLVHPERRRRSARGRVAARGPEGRY